MRVRAVGLWGCPDCDAPVGSACRPRGGKSAAKYHTPRFAECRSRPPSTADAITTHGHYSDPVTEGKNI
ncbi:zinc finger domain-containing protein [Streptomyces mirabilis]|uniref:zinc finger domain-containing protein n=1 Tax=Streptomyces mirabilis TaxID=68239 RepID=UPI003F4CFB70